MTFQSVTRQIDALPPKPKHKALKSFEKALYEFSIPNLFDKNKDSKALNKKEDDFD